MLTDLAMMLLRPGLVSLEVEFKSWLQSCACLGRKVLVVSVSLVEECGLFVESGFLMDPRCGKGFQKVNCLVPVKSLSM